MKLLLDTHIWIWSLSGSNKLRRNVARALANSRNELWLSPISIWEVVTLADRGRIRLDRPPEAWVADALNRVPLREAAVTREVALASRAVNLPHFDPADRLIAATALTYQLTLVTADKHLLHQPEIATLGNRT